MTPWVCPNAECSFDKELHSEQKCPLCGKQAKEFNYTELENLWKQKWNFKKSIEKTKKQELISKRKKFCPKCGSTNINVPVFYRPSVWKCLDCGYEGTFILENGKLAEKIREHHERT